MAVHLGAGNDEAWRDDVAEALAAYAVAHWDVAHVAHDAGAKRVLLDTLAVGLGAYTHAAAEIARQYLSAFPLDPEGATIWGSRHRAPVTVAALVNGVPLRCYDYNDVLVGKRSGGHPSDMVAALLAVAEWRGANGRAFLDALAVGYELSAAIFDFSYSEDSGWDHANLSALGATGALARLLGLTASQTAEAMGIVAIQHIQSNEIESSAPNRRGDLTMWKRFHGADIMRYALEACLLASKGVEGAVRPFRGDLGFLSLFRVPEDPAPLLAERLRPEQPPVAVASSNLKRWPVGSRGQSAIQAVIAARRQLPKDAEIAQVNVRTDPGVYSHLVEIRNDPWRPQAREAADHSLPYIVGTAALDGYVTVASFDLDRVLDPVRAAFIADKVKISVDEALGRGGASLNLSEVEIVTTTGERYLGEAKPARGHHVAPFSIHDLSEKLHENAAGVLPAAQLDALVAMVSELETVENMRELTALLIGDNAV